MSIVSKMKRPLGVAVASAMIAMSVMPVPAFADSQRIITIGADLSQSEEDTVLDFFGLTEDDLDQMQVIEVTNEDEKSYLSGVISDAVIGNETLSCSYIEPTTSGGINVETANLTYVTKNTLYNALQTAGVENVNLVVTAPYDVSGTGALTGVFMAYEQTGNELDEEKEQAATEEMVETAELEDTYGEDVASVISDVKNEVISQDGGELAEDAIIAIIDKYAQSRGLSLSEEDKQVIAGIADRVQNLEYDSDAFATTLDDIKDQIAGVSDQINERADGILGAIQDFFQGIADFFSNLFATITGQTNESAGNEAANENDAASQQHSTEGILGGLNTDVFELDNPSNDVVTEDEGVEQTDDEKGLLEFPSDKGTTDDGEATDGEPDTDADAGSSNENDAVGDTSEQSVNENDAE